jgi:hypothetical protein
MTSHSESESAISHGQENAASNDSNQLDSAGQAILKLLHKAAGVAEANSDKHYKPRKNFGVSFMLPRSGSPN